MPDFEGFVGQLRVRTILQELDAFLWNGVQTAEVTEWLGERFLGWVYANGELLLSLDNGHGEKLLARAGYLLTRYSDGRVVISSPNAASLTYEVADTGA